MAFTRIVDGHKPCTECKELLPVDNFGKARNVEVSKKTGEVKIKYYLNATCKGCARKISREWNFANKERMFLITRKWRNKLRDIVYKHYGNKCVCCGEDDYMFLTIDHINNDGYKERPRPAPGAYRGRKISGGMYKDIISREFPDDLQLLCYNCNCGKQRNFGVCPHVRIVEPKYGSRANLK